jgi:hypothetical protein
MGRGFVLQRRVRPVPEMCHDDNGELVPWIVTWGAFTGAGGHTGLYGRAVPAGSNTVMISRDGGAVACGCLAGRY